MERRKIALGSMLLVCMVGVAPPQADAKTSLRARVHKLEKRIAQLRVDVRAAQDTANIAADDVLYMAGCLKFVAITRAPQFVLPGTFATSIEPFVFADATTTPELTLWMATADPSCLVAAPTPAPGRAFGRHVLRLRVAHG